MKKGMNEFEESNKYYGRTGVDQVKRNRLKMETTQ
jgi:hypothetical protein